MASVNKAILVGNLGADPDLRYTQSQASVCTLSIATTDRRKNKAGDVVEYTEWHRVIVWNRQADACSQYLRKGSSVYVEGRISTRSWEDQKTGQKRYTTEVVAERVQFLGGKRQDNAKQGYAQPQQAQAPHQGSPTQGQAQHSEQGYAAPMVDTTDIDGIPF